MNVSGQSVQKHVERPSHPVPRKYVEPILYLAERMSQQDRKPPEERQRLLDKLAEGVRQKDFRRQPWFRQMNDQSACALIDLEASKRATLVVLALVMKSETTRGEAAKAYFRKVRELLGTDAIAVPAGIDEHYDLAERFLVGER